MTVWMIVGLPHMHIVEWAAVVKVGARSRGTKPVVYTIKYPSCTYAYIYRYFLITIIMEHDLESTYKTNLYEEF